MSSSRLPISSLFAWIAALIVGVAPAVLAADQGGILPRTQWVAAIVALVAVVLAIPVTFARQRATGLRPHLVAILLILAGGVALLQMTALPAKFVSVVSSGSAAAYQQWLQPLSMPAVDSQSVPAEFPISVAPWLTGGYAAMFAVAAAFGWVASTVFTSRQRIAMLLLLILATGTVHSAMGFYQLVQDPGANVWGVEGLEGGSPFGAFINRNNSSVLINLGLGCAIGLFAWRLSALTGYQLAGQPIPANAFLDLLTDRTAVLAMIGGIICGAGLIASGSRGGLAGGIAGCLFAFGLVSSIRRGRGLVTLTLGVALMTAILMVRYDLPHETLDRLGAAGEGVSKSVASDGRFDHWPDGVRAATAHFPAGSGAGTYRYAYLPYQQSSHASWYVNADNLWLEWLVEMGLAGIVLLVIFLLVTCRALIAVNYSPDALDHGLATAGWFAVGSIAVTQFFDFGLTLLPVALAAVVLFSAVITRSRSLRADSPILPEWMSFVLPTRHWAEDRNSWFYRLVSGRGPAAVALCGIGVAVFFAQSAFAVRTRSDRLQQDQRQLHASETATLEDWKQLIDAYYDHLDEAPHDAIGHLRLTEAELLYSRLSAAAATSNSVEALQQRLRVFSLPSLRSAWYRRIETETLDGTDGGRSTSPPLLDLSLTSSSAEADDDAEPQTGEPSPNATADDADAERSDQEPSSLVERLEEAGSPLPVPLLPIDSEVPMMIEGIGVVPGSLGPALYRVRTGAIAALRNYPLIDEGRYLLARLDFAGGSPKQARELLVQLASLRRQSGENLRQVGQAAATAQMWDLAASVWTRAIQVAPNQAPAILTQVDASPSLRPSDVVGRSPDALIAAVRFELRKTNYDPVLFERALDVLGATLPVERESRSARLELLAQIETKMGADEAAAKRYSQLVALRPGSADARYSYATALAAAGKINLARQQARAGRQLAPEDARFDRLIQQIAEQSKR